MKPENGMNPALVPYFSLEEYVGRIKVNDKVLYHLEDTNREFDAYVKRLANCGDYTILHQWISSLFRELKCSQEIENHLINPADMLKESIFFDTLQMNHARIKQLHQFVLNSDDDDNPQDYRGPGEEVRVSSFDDNGDETIYWHGAQGSDVKRFMDDFINIYKSNSLSLVHSNPFLKSAIVSLLFVRIHPFTDGNGRTSRMIYNIKFTDAINKIYNTKLKLCPLNLSKVIMLYRPTYARKINDIYFDLEHDNNEEINEWFDFILTRADEEIYCSTRQIPNLERGIENSEVFGQSVVSEAAKMNLKKLR